MSPSNKAVLLGSARVNMSCTSSYGFQAIAWSYTPIGSSTSTTISFAGSNVVTGQQPFYAVEQSSGSEQSNLIILSATTSRPGTYMCAEGASQTASAQLIVISKFIYLLLQCCDVRCRWRHNNVSNQQSCSYGISQSQLWLWDNKLGLCSSQKLIC